MVEVHGWLLFEIASLGYSIDSFEPFEEQQIAILCKASLNALVPWRLNNVLFRVMYSWFALTHVSLVDICVIVYVFISARQSQSTMLKLLDHVFVSSLRWRCRRWRIFPSMLGFHHVDLTEEMLCLQTVVWGPCLQKTSTSTRLFIPGNWILRLRRHPCSNSCFLSPEEKDVYLPSTIPALSGFSTFSHSQPAQSHEECLLCLFILMRFFACDSYLKGLHCRLLVFS